MILNATNKLRRFALNLGARMRQACQWGRKHRRDMAVQDHNTGVRSLEALEDRVLLATYNLTSFADSATDTATLRGAVNATNNSVDDIDTINLQAGTYTLSLNMTENVNVSSLSSPDDSWLSFWSAN